MMVRKFFKAKIHLWVVCLIGLLVISITLVGVFFGKSKMFDVFEESNETQVVTAMKKQKEVAVLGLSVTDIYDKSQATTFFGLDVPFSEKTSYLKGTFDAKLGFDGKQVKIKQSKVDDNKYTIIIPSFVVVGISNPKFEVVDSKGEMLSFVTENIDTHDLANKAMSDKTLKKYIKMNKEWLEEQSQTYYEGLLRKIDSNIKLEFKFE
ncbi:DUF4230 domain-containing protein [Vagococcus carniphilus]|uniref:DUF4230 domain-containing protein n=1 Tax=Vagococcus carniphilus TaxID=218144 RepID=UPI003B5B6246